MDYIFITTKLLIAFLILLTYLNLSGKRQLSKINTIDFIGNFIFSGAVGGAIYSNVSLYKYTITLLIVVSILYVLNYLSYKIIFFKETSIGHPIPIIKDGKFMIDSIKNKKLEVDIFNIAKQLRLKGIHSFSKVTYAQIETTGELTAVTEKNGDTSWILIKEGQIMTYELEKVGKNKEWLKKEIKKKGFKDFNDIFIVEYWKEKLSIILQDGKIII